MTKIPLLPKQFIVPFILTTILFAMWGFANNFTDPLVKVFKDVFDTTNAQSTWVQMAFYGGYATMAIPAALFIRRFSYKAGILAGLSLFALGTFLTVPAASLQSFWFFILAFYILTFGLAFLETTANPYILSMGDPKTATQRLNLAQAFNPVGVLMGISAATTFVLGGIEMADFKQDVESFKQELSVNKEVKAELAVLPFLKAKEKEPNRDANIKAYVESVTPEKVDVTQAISDFREGKIESYQGKTFKELQGHDLSLVAKIYMCLGLVVSLLLAMFLIKKMPESTSEEDSKDSDLINTLGRLIKNPRYSFGVIAQMFYVGAQIMIWTFLFHYADKELGMDGATAGNHYFAALVLFLSFRFNCTFLLKFVQPGQLLFVLAIGGISTTLGAIYLTGMPGLYSLMLVSACMSLMFPTIYGIALDGVDQDAKLGSAGLVFAIVGGVWLTGFHGALLDYDTVMGLSPTRGAFYLSVICFLIIAVYGFMCRKPRQIEA